MPFGSIFAKWSFSLHLSPMSSNFDLFGYFLLPTSKHESFCYYPIPLVPYRNSVYTWKPFRNLNIFFICLFSSHSPVPSLGYIPSISSTYLIIFPTCYKYNCFSLKHVTTVLVQEIGVEKVLIKDCNFLHFHGVRREFLGIPLS